MWRVSVGGGYLGVVEAKKEPRWSPEWPRGPNLAPSPSSQSLPVARSPSPALGCNQRSVVGYSVASQQLFSKPAAPSPRAPAPAPSAGPAG